MNRRAVRMNLTCSRVEGESTRTSGVIRQASRIHIPPSLPPRLRRPLFSTTHTGRLGAQKMCEVGVAVGSFGAPPEESPSPAEQGAG
jgi:hypothetical protein